MTYRALVSDKLSEQGVALLKASGQIEVDVKTGLAPDELAAIIGDYDALIIRSATKVTAPIIEAAHRLKVIGRAGIGVDNVDTPAASAKGIVVMNTPGGNTVTTAEHAIAMMAALARRIPAATASIRAGKWEKSRFSGVELSGKTLGIVGLGRIGALVAKRAIGLEMKVIGHDPYLTAEAAGRIGVTLVPLNELYASADFISIHTQLTSETRGMIGHDALWNMKKGVRIVNCARGGLIDEEELADAIRQGVVAGAAIDVFETEPPGDKNPLLELEEVIFTPHLGGSTVEALEKVSVAVAEQVADYLTRGIIQNAVNVPSVDPDEFRVIGPYMDLGERIGSLLSQIIDGPTEKIEITYMGDIAERSIRPITQAVVKGALEAKLGPTVNLVNAPFLAEERGVEVKAGTSSQKRNFASLIEVKVTAENKTLRAEGTVFVGDEPRMVRLEEVFIESKLSGALLVFTNRDAPGVIGDIGHALGRRGINIASFELGRESKGGNAIAIVSIDATPDVATLDEMKHLPNITAIHAVTLPT